MDKSKTEFNKIHTAFHGKILRYLGMYIGKDEAEDLTQEVFVKVHKGLSGFRRGSKLSTWIYAIATNAALDRLRLQKHSRSYEEYSLDDIDEPEDREVWSGRKRIPVDQEIIRKEMSECVKEYVNRLPHAYRTVIILSEFEGFRNREIAEILQVTTDTVKIRLHRARAYLRKLLGNGCDFYHNDQGVLACDRKPVTLKFKRTG